MIYPLNDLLKSLAVGKVVRFFDSPFNLMTSIILGQPACKK